MNLYIIEQCPRLYIDRLARRAPIRFVDGHDFRSLPHVDPKFR